jgi:NAD(P)-dependent dehydrogenase (short-subunit alcohol dehydrogenase family)
MDLQDKVALVTGAGSGIGKAAAVRLAREGARVGVLSRTHDEIQAVAQEIEQAGGQAIPLLADISDADQMRHAIEALVGAYGRLDIVFANAGINGVWAPIGELQPEEGTRRLPTICGAPI